MCGQARNRDQYEAGTLLMTLRPTTKSPTECVLNCLIALNLIVTGRLSGSCTFLLDATSSTAAWEHAFSNQHDLHTRLQ